MPDSAGSGVDGLRTAVAGIWCAVLGVDTVSPEDDFFLEGGDSALAVETAINLRAVTGTEVDLDVVYRYPEFGQLMAALAEPQSAAEERPLTAAEERLWFAERLHPGSPQYHIVALYRFDGHIDVLRLRSALDALVMRHSALRRGFDAPGRAVTAPRASVSCRWLDAQGLSDAALRELLDDTARRPFDLSRPPLLRALAVDRGGDGDLLLLTVHHLVCDGSSLALLEDGLSRLYSDGAAANESTPEPEAGATRQARADGSSRMLGRDASRAYWRRILAGSPRSIALPHDLPRPAAMDNAGDVHALSCAEDLLADMAALAAQERLSAFMTWVVAYAAGLVGMTGERDVVIGIAASSRSAEQRGEIGMFVDPLPLRLSIPAGTTTRDLARQVRRATTEALAHQGVSFQEIVDDLGPGGDPSRAPLIQAGLTYLDASDCGLWFDGVAASRELLPTGTAKYELLWSVTRRADGTLTELEFSSRLFSADRAAAVHSGLIAAAREAYARPDAPLRVGATAVAVAPPRPAALRPLPELIHEWAQRQPTAPALRYKDVELTYRQLDERALAVAAGLRAAGLRRGAVVAVPMLRGADSVTAYLGIFYAGCAYLPLDPEQPAERIRAALDGIADAALVTNPLASLPPALPVLRLPDLLTGVAGDSAAPLPVRVTGEDAAYLMSTSGSTGRPKTVVVPHRGISRLVPNADGLVMRSDDRVAHLCNPAFDASILEIWGALGAGAVLVVADKEEVLSPTRLSAFIDEHRISVVGLPTALLHTMVDFAPDAFSAVRLLMFGGEKADERRLVRLMSRRPPTSVVNVYGPTENTTVSTLQVVTRSALEPGPLSIGRPVSRSTAYAVGPDGALVAPGGEGELYVGGDGLASGYRGNPALTAASFVPDPFGSGGGGRLYRTGDRVRVRPDGSFDFVGRVDDQVKVRGFRVELGEIEHALRSLPGVVDAVAFARETPDGAELVASVAAESDPAELADRLRTRLPGYMIPALVVTDRMPLTANGKVDRAAVLAGLPGVIPRQGGPSDADEPSPPSADDADTGTDTLTDAVTALWCDALGTDPSRPVGLDDNFVTLGGHSIKALKLLARVEEKLGAAVDLADFLADPTLRGLVTAVRDLS